MDFLKRLKPQSRKFVVFVVMVLLCVGNALAGGIISEDAIEKIMAITIAWIASQGIADAGAQGKANAVKKMKDETEDMRDLLKEVLGSGTPIAKKIDLTDDENPKWSDTSEVDDDDRKVLEG